MGKKVTVQSFHYPILVICNNFNSKSELQKAKSRKIKESLKFHQNLIYEIHETESLNNQNMFGGILATFLNMVMSSYDEEDLSKLLLNDQNEDDGICCDFD